MRAKICLIPALFFSENNAGRNYDTSGQHYESRALASTRVKNLDSSQLELHKYESNLYTGVYISNQHGICRSADQSRTAQLKILD